jgi:multiple sugar transport system ATP-binding protein
LKAEGAQDGKVWVGVRPEGFIPKEDGAFTLTLNAVEVMGRDTSVVASHKDSENENIRAIISSDTLVDESKETVRFDLKPNKVFVFDTETEERIGVSLSPIDEQTP